MHDECLICGAPLVYLETDEQMECAVCHKTEHSKTRCVNGHYVCDACHTGGMDAIFALCLRETSKNPVEIKEMHGIDMEQTQYSKLLSDIPAMDRMISMGCGVNCPVGAKPYDEDWGLEDPTGKPDEAFRETVRAIEAKILQLRSQLE